jgi:hypothetical protein
MRPVIRQMIRYESLLDGTLDLIDIARIHDALNVSDENEFRMQEAARK